MRQPCLGNRIYTYSETNCMESVALRCRAYNHFSGSGWNRTALSANAVRWCGDRRGPRPCLGFQLVAKFIPLQAAVQPLFKMCPDAYGVAWRHRGRGSRCHEFCGRNGFAAALQRIGSVHQKARDSGRVPFDTGHVKRRDRVDPLAATRRYLETLDLLPASRPHNAILRPGFNANTVKKKYNCFSGCKIGDQHTCTLSDF